MIKNMLDIVCDPALQQVQQSLELVKENIMAMTGHKSCRHGA